MDSEEPSNLYVVRPNKIRRHCDGTEKTYCAWVVTVTTDAQRHKYLLNSGQVITDLPSSSRTECSVVTELRNNLPGTERTDVCKLGRGAELWQCGEITAGIELLLLLLVVVVVLTAIALSLGGSSPYTSTHKTNKNKYT